MYEFTLTRPITEADEPWIKLMRNMARKICQCKTITAVSERHGEIPMTWLEHCPLHTLTGERTRA